MINEFAEPDDCCRIRQVLPSDGPVSGVFCILDMTPERETEQLGFGERDVTETIILMDDPDRFLCVVRDLKEIIASKYA